MTDPAVQAAAPALIAVLQAVQTFNNQVLGGDPATIAVRVPGALAVLVGTVELQLPVVATAEVGVVQNDINTKINQMIAKLKG
jgi:hypothetical protein